MPTEVKVQDIRRQECDLTNLRSELVAGLVNADTAKSIPSLLLWDEKGQQLFADITASPDYYTYRAELSLLNQWNEDIIASVESGTVIIELGAGNCKKTGVLLRALHRQQKSIKYFALDVAADPLIESLAQMTRMLGKSNYISCQGLLGTYEDCMSLLEQDKQLFRNRKLLFLWLGNSITNMTWETSVDSLRRLLQYPDSELLVSVDGNRNLDTVQRAYDLPDGKIRRFVRNGLTHANRLLGEEVLKEDDWDFESSWDAEGKAQQLYHVAKRDLSLEVDGTILRIMKGEKIHAITSAKWTVNEIQDLCSAAEVDLKRAWIEPVYNFGCFLLGQ
nr:methyltransferase domain [Aspergillus sp.]